ncbi:hypothetical protein MCOR31_010673 [Pyricularia oryzae]|nr:hypothetical protein MCOR31_010673 [Pyricularia oryzae]KAI6409230.1 hypothetical protein MCOR24_007269 [Pyricularia oryzae]
MRSSYFALLLAPTAVLSRRIVIQPTTGDLCCDRGTPDDSETCKKQGLNSYCCSQARNNNRGGCEPEKLEIFNFGRSVTSFVPGGTCERRDSAGNTFVGFIGCAK